MGTEWQLTAKPSCLSSLSPSLSHLLTCCQQEACTQAELCSGGLDGEPVACSAEQAAMLAGADFTVRSGPAFLSVT